MSRWIPAVALLAGLLPATLMAAGASPRQTAPKSAGTAVQAPMDFGAPQGERFLAPEVLARRRDRERLRHMQRMRSGEKNAFHLGICKGCFQLRGEPEAVTRCKFFDAFRLLAHSMHKAE